MCYLASMNRIVLILLLVSSGISHTGCEQLYAEWAFDRVREAQALGDFDEMLRLSLPLAQKSGDYQFQFLVFTGRAYRGKGAYRSAERVAEYGLTRARDDLERSEFYDQLAEIHAVAERDSLARHYARLSVEADPSDVIKWNNWGHTCIQLEDYTEAIRIFDAAAARFPPHPYILNNRAEAHLSLGQLVEADADMRASHALEPRNPYLYKNKARYYQQLDEPALMCENARRAASLFSEAFGYAYDQAAIRELLSDCGLE